MAAVPAPPPARRFPLPATTIGLQQTPAHRRPGLPIIADKGYVSRELDGHLAQRGVRLLRPSYRNRTPHPAKHLLKPVRQPSSRSTTPSDLELHGGRTIDGVTAHIGQRLLALTAAIWHNRATGRPVS